MKSDILRLAQEGNTIDEIIRQSECSKYTVLKQISELVTSGDLQHTAKRKLESRVAKYGKRVVRSHASSCHGLKLGVTVDILMNLTSDQIVWLGNTVPEGVTLVEFCTAILRDLYDEDRRK